MVPVRRTQTWLPDIFNDFFDNTWMEKTNATAPAINIRETETNYEIEVAAPGMTREDFTIKIENNNQLVVSMKPVCHLIFCPRELLAKKVPICRQP